MDKQIEMKTSDGRRRITPIFILPNSEAANSMMANPVVGNGTNGNSTSSESLAKYHMQSSSSGAKSKIRIEKVDGVVEPNVSPGKKKEGKSSTTMISTSSTTSPTRANTTTINGGRSKSVSCPTIVDFGTIIEVDILMLF